MQTEVKMLVDTFIIKAIHVYNNALNIMIKIIIVLTLVMAN